MTTQNTIKRDADFYKQRGIDAFHKAQNDGYTVDQLRELGRSLQGSSWQKDAEHSGFMSKFNGLQNATGHQTVWYFGTPVPDSLRSSVNAVLSHAFFLGDRAEKIRHATGAYTRRANRYRAKQQALISKWQGIVDAAVLAGV